MSLLYQHPLRPSLQFPTVSLPLCIVNFCSSLDYNFRAATLTKTMIIWPRLDRSVPIGRGGARTSLAVYPAEATNAFFVIFPFKELNLLMASYTTGDFLRLVSEHETEVYKYPAGTVYPSRTAAGVVILASYLLVGWDEGKIGLMHWLD